MGWKGRMEGEGRRDEGKKEEWKKEKVGRKMGKEVWRVLLQKIDTACKESTEQTGKIKFLNNQKRYNNKRDNKINEDTALLAWYQKNNKKAQLKKEESDNKSKPWL